MSFKPLTIASRQSPLAVMQAEWVRDHLAAAMHLSPDDAAEAFPIRTYITTGDQRMDPSLADIGGKGLFTKEVEAALLRGEADIAVHSMKDMPALMPNGLVRAAIPIREDPRDALVSPQGIALADLPAGARVGTSSIRRRAQLARRRPDLTLVPMRGNVGTRLQKLSAGEADATFLAEAGLRRLGRGDVLRSTIEPEEMLPAPGQGILCVQAREDDDAALEICTLINCAKTSVASRAERAVVTRLDASCRTPVAAYAREIDGHLRLDAEILTLDGQTVYADHRSIAITGSSAGEHAAQAGHELATLLVQEAGPDLAKIIPTL